MNKIISMLDNTDDIQVFITSLCNEENNKPLKGVFQVAVRGIKINEIKLLLIGDKKIMQYPCATDPKTGKVITFVFPFEKAVSDKIKEKILVLYDFEQKRKHENVLIA